MAHIIFPLQLQNQSMGRIYVRCTDEGQIPIEGAIITITLPNTTTILERLVTNSLGITDLVYLQAPDIELSLEPSSEQPYSLYDIMVNAEGYQTTVFYGVQILPNTIFQQNVELRRFSETEPDQINKYLITPNALYGDYPEKIWEDSVKSDLPPSNDRFSFAPVGPGKVVVPEYIIVHDGYKANKSAPNYKVYFKDYIKNVVCSEIFSTWPEACITANTLVILSFTLSRYYTEWYKSQGFDFTITTSTQDDQKWIKGQSIAENVSLIVDGIFNNYLSLPDVKQPIFTQYCDGRRVKCPKWLSQWGSKELADKGYSPLDIIRYYFGREIYINIAEIIEGLPESWGGENLTLGSVGESVKTVQESLNSISVAYPLIPKLFVDGVYGTKTEEGVKIFQKIVALPRTGVVDKNTWYKLSWVYVAVNKIVYR